MRYVPLCAALLLLPAMSFAQAERYELGKRLKAFEIAWEEPADEASRKRALEVLPKVTSQFFAFQLGEAGRTLDTARFLLKSKDEPSEAVRWLTALYANPEKRLVDSTVKELSVEVKAFYKQVGTMTAIATATLRIGEGPEVTVPLDKLPVKMLVPFPNDRDQGDWQLTLKTTLNRKIQSATHTQVSKLTDLSAWLASSKTQWAKLHKNTDLSRTKCGLEIATWRERVQMFADLADGEVPETDLSVGMMGFGPRSFTAKEEAIVAGYFASQFSHFYAASPERALLGGGDFRLSVPLGKTKTVPIRLHVPSFVKLDKPVPLVFALHGAGGTENLFFEGYGNGHVVKECKKRGWMLVAPRSGINFTGGPPVKAILDCLADRFPIDRKRIFLVGHSMGAAQTIALCQDQPGMFAAAAALGGGGRVTDGKAFATLPIFVGIGDKDFALSGAKALSASLTKAGATAMTYKEYPGLEHLIIVREALPDVFAMFDTVAKP